MNRLTSLLLAYGDSVQLVLFCAGFASLWLVEVFAGFRFPVHRPGRLRANLALTACSVATILALPLGLIGAAHWSEARGIGLLHALGPAPVVAGCATILLRALLSYAVHWLMHRVPWLWRLHRVHHLDTELDVTTTVRFHPLELVVGAALGVPVVALLGLTPWALVLYELLDVAVTLASHANLRLPRGIERRLRYVLVTPTLHRVHHSARPGETDSNFGAVLPVWDLVFRTYRPTPADDERSMQLGLSRIRDARADSVTWLLVSPLRDDINDQDDRRSRP